MNKVEQFWNNFCIEEDTEGIEYKEAFQFGTSAVIFTVLYSILVDMPSSIRGWSELIGFTFSGGVVMFLTNYISLKRSYNKNKELL